MVKLKTAIQKYFIVLFLLICLDSLVQGRDDKSNYADRFDYVPSIFGQINGYPIKTIGTLEYLTVSPDLQADLTIQKGNNYPRSKIITREINQIKHNYLGITQSQLPSSEIGGEFA